MTEKELVESPRRIAVVGAGPAGMFAAADLLRSGVPVVVDLFEQWWAPFGLLRYGVAPDHLTTRRVAKTFSKWFDHGGLRFFGNVCVGRDVGVEELARHYDAVLVATGAQHDRRLAIPGADLAGCHTSLEFVGWYNAHPEHARRSFPLGTDTAVVIGNGNVAMDVARILARNPDDLAATELSRSALAALRKSAIRTIFIVGRRGLAQASFTYNELHELANIEGVELDLLPGDLELSETDRDYVARAPDAVPRRQMVEAFRELAGRPKPAAARRRIAFRFHRQAVAIEGSARVERIRFFLPRPAESDASPGGGEEVIPCGLVIQSIGHRGAPVSGLPFDPVREVIPCDRGRVVQGGEPLAPFYAVGWIERGARGLLGNNKPDAKAAVDTLLADLPHLPRPCESDPEALPGQLRARGVRVVGKADWACIAAEEERRGDRFTAWSEVQAFLSSPVRAALPQGGAQG